MTKNMTSKNKQTGVVLVVSLIMLLLLTLIGVTGTQVTTLEEKMAGNARDQNVAFQAAEATLIEAENFILLSTTNTATFTIGTAGLLGQDDPATTSIEFPEPDFFNATAWTSANSAATTDFGEKFVNNNGKHIADPRYIIKHMVTIPASGSVGARKIYRITARAQGISPGTQVVLQEYFERTN